MISNTITASPPPSPRGRRRRRAPRCRVCRRRPTRQCSVHPARRIAADVSRTSRPRHHRTRAEPARTRSSRNPYADRRAPHGIRTPCGAIQGRRRIRLSAESVSAGERFSGGHGPHATMTCGLTSVAQRTRPSPPRGLGRGLRRTSAAIVRVRSRRRRPPTRRDRQNACLFSGRAGYGRRDSAPVRRRPSR